MASLLSLGALLSIGCASRSADDGARGSTGCDDPPADFTDGERSLDTGGETRSYLIERPDDSTDSPLPLVMDIHGARANSESQLALSDMSDLARSRRFVHVLPQSPQNPETQRGLWRWPADGPDVAFLFDLLDEVEANVCIDLDRVYVTGFSQGGYLSLVMACQQPERIAAVAPVAGLVDIEPCHRAVPVPVLAIHGTADDVMSFDGRINPNLTASLGYEEGPTVPELAEGWAGRNGCHDVPTSTSLSDGWTRASYPCDAGGVELYTRLDGGHEWPDRVGDQPTSEVIWAFFESQALDG